MTASRRPVPPACAGTPHHAAARQRNHRSSSPPLTSTARRCSSPASPRLLPGSPPPLAAAPPLPAFSPLLTILLFCQLRCQVPSSTSPSSTDIKPAKLLPPPPTGPRPAPHWQPPGPRADQFISRPPSPGTGRPAPAPPPPYSHPTSNSPTPADVIPQHPLKSSPSSQSSSPPQRCHLPSQSIHSIPILPPAPPYPPPLSLPSPLSPLPSESASPSASLLVTLWVICIPDVALQLILCARAHPKMTSLFCRPLMDPRLSLKRSSGARGGPE